MIAITAVAGYIPEGRLDSAERFEDFAINQTFLDTKIGVRKVARKDAGEETSDLCVRAYEALCAKHDVDAESIDCIVVCTQNPDGGGIPHVSAITHGKLGLPKTCAGFDISLGCSGFVYGLSVAGAFMQANGLRNGLFFTADPYSKIVDPNDKNTCLLFGDGAAVTLLQETDDAPHGWTPSAFSFFSDGARGNALMVETDTLHMNGRAVFTFSATEAPKLIDATLEKAGMSRGDADLYLLHQGSKYIVDTIRDRLELAPEKVPSNLAKAGNTVSSSIPLLLAEHMDNDDVSRIVLCGFGVGLSAASCVIPRRTP